jgi:hypothetical protein
MTAAKELLAENASRTSKQTAATSSDRKTGGKSRTEGDSDGEGEEDASVSDDEADSEGATKAADGGKPPADGEGECELCACV